MLEVCEIFESIQCEGSTIGKPSLFIRLSKCNMSCVWCDSKYSWANGKKYQVEELVQIIKELACSNVVITGGEPLLQKENIIELLKLLPKNITVEIETNGTILPNNKIFDNVLFNVSPKLFNSGMVLDVFNNLQRFNISCNCIFKFVVNNESDVEEIKALTKNINSNKIYLMPEGINKLEQEDRMGFVIDICKKHGYNFSPRLHILIWNDKKGV